MDGRLIALRELRTVAKRFVGGAMTFDAFHQACDVFLGDFFDAEELQEVEGPLSGPHRAERNFYELWIGKAREDRFRDPNWRYGDPRPSGWVDGQAFREAFRSALDNLTLAPIE